MASSRERRTSTDSTFSDESESGVLGKPSSFGLICIRKNKGAYEMILIRSKHTWQRSAIIHGKYGKETDTPEKIQQFVSKMTLAEKQSLVDSEFVDYNEPPSPSSHANKHEENEFCFICQYRECFRKMLINFNTYERREHETRALQYFRTNMPKLVRPMIQSIKNGENGELPWSIPKGRPMRRKWDDGLTVAIKEFTEETQIQPDMYIVHKDVPSYFVQYSDAGKTWTFEFFFATARDHLKFQYNPECKEQVGEISLIQWHTVESLGSLPLDSITRVQLCDRMQSMFDHYHLHIGSKFTPISNHFRLPSPKHDEPNVKISLRPHTRSV